MTTMNTDLPAAKRFLEELRGESPLSLLCAVSGGLDSMCLLQLLSTWGRERDMTVMAAHFNHRLRGAESDRDEAFVRSWCAAREIPFVCGGGDVADFAAETGQSVEEAARTLRYRFLEEQRQARGCAYVLTAHHADDNAETMLLNLLRGTGLRGLAGIPEIRERIARPFLSHTRAELAAYADETGLAYVEDSTNAEDEASRNLLRHKVLPVLRELNPKAVENINRTARQLRQDEEALACMAEALLEQAGQAGDGWYLPVEACLEAEPAVAARAVHGLLARTGGHRKDLTAAHVESVCALLEAPAGKEISLPYGVIARREEGRLVMAVRETAHGETELVPGQTVSFGSWQVRLSAEEAGWGVAVPENGVLTVTGWKRDDRMTLPGTRGARSLKRLCAEQGVSLSQREELPVLRINGRAAAVPGIGVDLEFVPQAGNTAVYITFHQQRRNDL